MTEYADFLSRKALTPIMAGYDDDPAPHPEMFPHQSDTFRFMARVGRGAAFLETGLGKALLALHWGQLVSEREGRPVLIFAPLAVAQQFVREGNKFGIPCRYVRDRDELRPGVNATNYDRLHGFSPDDLAGIVLDESGILKALTGSTKRALIDFAQGIRFRLCCSATPAPNDHMELGNHAEFLGIMSSNEMLSRFFVNDTSTASQVWRLKGHAKEAFWDWIATWAFGVTKPSDFGYSDQGFALPRLDVIKHVVDVDITKDRGETLFRIAAVGSMDLHREKRLTLDERVAKVAEVVHGQPDEDWIVWCHSNAEADALALEIDEALEVRGNDTLEYKIHAAEWFCRYREDRPCRGRPNTKKIESESEKQIQSHSSERRRQRRVLISKPRIFGWGMNFQACARMAFVGISFSFEESYQAIRRCWRFGQKREVEVHVVVPPTEAGVWDAVMRKQHQHDEMKIGLMDAMKRAHGSGARRRTPYNPQHIAPLASWIRSA